MHVKEDAFTSLLNVAEWFTDTVICHLVCCSPILVTALTIHVKNETAIMCCSVPRIHQLSSALPGKAACS